MDKVVYYVQNDVLCLVMLIVMLCGMLIRKERTRNQKLFEGFILVSMLCCISDAIGWCFYGKSTKASLVMQNCSNIVYFISSTLSGVIWSLYVLEKIHPNQDDSKRYFLAVPFAIFALFILISPLHQLVFKIVRENGVYIYQRGSYIWLHWMVVGLYVLGPSIYALVYIIREKDKTKKKSFVPLFLVLIFPIICTVIQIVFSGISAIQFGMTISVLYVYLHHQTTNAYTDELTGLNNRRYLNMYLDEKMLSLSNDENVFLVMVDIDNFKGINDAFGHPTGDDVLRTMGWLLSEVAKKHHHIFTARYGGDEFVIFGYGKTLEQVTDIISDLHAVVQMENINDHKINVSISTGYIHGKKEDFSNVDMMLSMADTQLYKIKSKKKFE